MARVAGGLHAAGLVRPGVAQPLPRRRLESLAPQSGRHLLAFARGSELAQRRPGRRRFDPPRPLLRGRLLLRRWPWGRGHIRCAAADLAHRHRHRGLFRHGRRLSRLDLDVEQEPDGLLLQRLQHRPEHVETLAAVLDQRVALRHRPQPDALLEVVHLVEVLAPLAVQDAEHHPALEFPHRTRADLAVNLALALGVCGTRVLQDHFQQTLLGEVFLVLDERFPTDRHRVQGLQRGPELLEVPILGVAFGGLRVDVGIDHVGEHVHDLLVQVLTGQHAVPLVVDDGPLLVHDLVVLEDVLADLHVLLLDLGLRAADGAADHLVLDRHVVGHLEPGHHGLDHRGVEAPHQLVAQRQVEPGLAGVALAAGAATQLVVDAPRLVALGAQHVEPADAADLLTLGLDLGLDLLDDPGPFGLVLLAVLHRVEATAAQFGVGDVVDVAAEHDVGSAAGHVGGDRDRALAPGLGDDRGFTRVVLGVQHVVRDALLGEQLRQVLGALHAGGADQDRLPRLEPLLDVLGDRLELRRFGLVHQVGLVEAGHRLVRRDRHHTELVSGVELGRLGLGGTGHARQLVVEAEVVLQGDRGERLVLGLDLDAFLGLDRLVHALVVAAPGQDAAGELVDDQHLAVADDVILVTLVELLGLQCIVEVADQRGVGRLVEVVDTELVLDDRDAFFGHADGALALVHFVVLVALEHRGEPRELLVPARGLVGRAGDDQRRPGLVDQDGVDLIDDREVVPALHAIGEAPGHVVAQVVEAELVVRAVGDVRGVCLAPLFRRHVGQDRADLKPEEAVHATHPLGVAAGQVVVDRDDVHALASDRVEVGGQHAGQGLSLTGLHFGDIAEVQRGAAHQLHVEVPLAEGALGTFAGSREGLRQQFVQGFTVGVAAFELVGLAPQLGVGERDDVLFKLVDVRCDGAQTLEHFALAGAEQSGQDHPVDLTS